MDHLGQDVTQQEVQTMFVDYGDVNGVSLPPIICSLL